jgi:hypothetical protein
MTISRSPVSVRHLKKESCFFFFLKEHKRHKLSIEIHHQTFIFDSFLFLTCHFCRLIFKKKVLISMKAATTLLSMTTRDSRIDSILRKRLCNVNDTQHEIFNIPSRDSIFVPSTIQQVDRL